MKITPKTIALAGVALLLAGSMALAGDHHDVSQNDGAAPGGGSRGLVTGAGVGEDGIADVERKVPFGMRITRTDICGEAGEDDKCRPRPPVNLNPGKMSTRYVGGCLPYPILGRTFCWGI